MKRVQFKKEWSLWIAALLLTVFLIGYTVYSVRSLARLVGAAFVEAPSAGAPESSFDFEGLDNILKAKGLAVPTR